MRARAPPPPPWSPHPDSASSGPQFCKSTTVLIEVSGSEGTRTGRQGCNPGNLKMGSNESWFKSAPPHPVQFTRKTEQLRPGQIITVRGQIPEGPGRFAVNLKDHKDDIAFHFNPRFDEHQEPCIVCNTHRGIFWDSEERTSYVPFEPGDCVEIAIKVEKKYYQVSVKGQHLLSYRHRLPLHNIETVVVTGYLKSPEIQIDDSDSSQNPAQEPKDSDSSQNPAQGPKGVDSCQSPTQGSQGVDSSKNLI